LVDSLKIWKKDVGQTEWWCCRESIKIPQDLPILLDLDFIHISINKK